MNVNNYLTQNYKILNSNYVLPLDIYDYNKCFSFLSKGKLNINDRCFIAAKAKNRTLLNIEMKRDKKTGNKLYIDNLCATAAYSNDFNMLKICYSCGYTIFENSSIYAAMNNNLTMLIWIKEQNAPISTTIAHIAADNLNEDIIVWCLQNNIY